MRRYVSTRTSIELGWSGARARRLGALEAHVRYLQYIFRRSVELRPGCWRRGGMRGLMSELVSVRATRCKGGENLAGADEFDAQSERAARVGCTGGCADVVLRCSITSAAE